ncbi:hypothetical protein AOLI_G00091230 [Acnodon oligacanthus]
MQGLMSCVLRSMGVNDSSSLQPYTVPAVRREAGRGAANLQGCQKSQSGITAGFGPDSVQANERLHPVVTGTN